MTIGNRFFVFVLYVCIYVCEYVCVYYNSFVFLVNIDIEKEYEMVLPRV